MGRNVRWPLWVCRSLGRREPGAEWQDALCSQHFKALYDRAQWSLQVTYRAVQDPAPGKGWVQIQPRFSQSCHYLILSCCYSVLLKHVMVNYQRQLANWIVSRCWWKQKSFAFETQNGDSLKFPLKINPKISYLLIKTVTWKEGNNVFQQVSQVRQLQPHQALGLSFPHQKTLQRLKNLPWEAVPARTNLKNGPWRPNSSMKDMTRWAGECDWGSSKARPQSWEGIKSWRYSDYSGKGSSHERAQKARVLVHRGRKRKHDWIHPNAVL